MNADFWGELCDGIKQNYSDQQCHDLRLLENGIGDKWRKQNWKLYHRVSSRKAKTRGRLCWELSPSMKLSAYPVGQCPPIAQHPMPLPFVGGYHPKMDGFIVPTAIGIEYVDAEPASTLDAPPTYVIHNVPRCYVESELKIREHKKTVKRDIWRNGQKDVIDDVTSYMETTEKDIHFIELSNRTRFVNGMVESESESTTKMRIEACKRWCAPRTDNNPKSESFGELLPIGKLTTTADGRDVPDILVSDWQDDGQGISLASIPQYVRSALAKQWRSMLEQFRPGLKLYAIRREFIQEALQTIAQHHYEVLRGIRQFAGVCDGLHAVCQVFILRYGIKRKSNAEKGLENDFATARKVNRRGMSDDIVRMMAGEIEFATGRQELVVRSILCGENQEALAQRMGISQSTISKEWKACIEFNRAMK